MQGGEPTTLPPPRNMKNGPVKTFVPDPSDPSDPSDAAKLAKPGQLIGFGFSLAKVAPAKTAAAAKTAAVAISWPAETIQLAAAIGCSLPEFPPAKGKSPAGALLSLPKGSPYAGQAKPPTVGSLKRRDAAVVWASWLAYGCDGQAASMAGGQPLPLADMLRSLIGSGLTGAAFKTLWTGSGDRTCLLGQLSAHTGQVVTLTLADQLIRLS